MKEAFSAPPNLAAQTLSATRAAAAASIAGGLIAASRRPHNLEDAMKIYQDVYHAMWPSPENGGYEAWKADPKAMTKTYT